MSKKQPHSSIVADRIVQDQNLFAWKIFNAFTSDGQLSASDEDLLNYATTELKLDLSNVPACVVENLPLILVIFMNLWTGWHFKTEFLAEQFKKDHYFKRFHKYMVHRINVLLRSSFVRQLSKSSSNVEGQVATKYTDLPFAPYSILIKCPASMMNTLAFSDENDDVIMKQHLGTTWLDLSTTQLTNWPHVEVSFKTQDICFVRRSAIEFVRYLNFLPHECQKTNENIIEHVETLRNSGRIKYCYSHHLLEEYTKEYLKALKTIKNLQEEKLEEIQSILVQFLEDVRYIKVNRSMATDTLVLFKLCPVPFIRNKKLVKNLDKEQEDARVGYCEIITPKIELVLLYYHGVQKEGPYVRFEHPEKIKECAHFSDINSLLPNIAYKCTFCKLEFNTCDSKKLMMNHLKKEHKTEQHVRCTLCKKQFDVLNLAGCRWRHKCVPAPTVPPLPPPIVH